MKVKADEHEAGLIEVRLLRLFEAIHATQSVTRAAEQLGQTQPTVSIGLGHLRRQFGDPLFVRTSEGMRPTPHADALIGPVRQVLQALRQLSEQGPVFDPLTATRMFRIGMTDASHITLLPQLLAHIRAHAPHVQLEAMQIDETIPQALQMGDADIAIGLIPGLEAGFYQQTLYAQDWVCLAQHPHPHLAGGLSLDAYKAEAHIDIVSGTGQDLLEEALKIHGVDRRVLLRLPGFLGLARILSGSDLIATLPRHIGETLAALGGLKVHACPLPIPGFTVKQHWHARFHHDPANRWLRGVCAELFLKGGEHALG
ncbi:LysR family transcriptional regulator [Telmatospirillum siberiense]|uniref:LysR family transcriptional regulator n=1 Tax=Telmatospirillum siberiense TaxID=382514 RepID=A0A2N3PP29_9PROT|nr:LysR family transcriptional regulator [Telmatospirillum siberiense]PKU22183.1 LysR family transcriptional regulator [Telmatospirillum siberiense]